MKWYLNELSLCGQYASICEFVEDLYPIIELRKFTWIRNSLFFASPLKQQQACAGLTFSEALYRLPQSDFRKSVLQWIDKFGPFIEDHRKDEPEDYFQYEMIEVTNRGLGEAARRTKNSEVCSSFSFGAKNEPFKAPFLHVQHGLDEEPLGMIMTSNEWQPQNVLQTAFQALPKLETYEQLLVRCRERYRLLALPPQITESMAREPFSQAVADRVIELLKILNEFMEHRAADGSVSSGGQRILKEHFQKGSTRFSDESDTNKRLFEADMTFKDPTNRNQLIVCFWHAKIQTPQMRIHFEWPVPINQRVLKVAYIGPKISKK